HAVCSNAGQPALAVRRYVRALRALEQYLHEGEGHISPERLADVQSMIETLRSRTAHLTITVNVKGAEISLDDHPVGTSPLSEPVVVDVGRHTLTVHAAGHDPFSREVVVAG